MAEFVRKRFSSGFSFDANYTWSKALGNGGGDTGVYYDGENGTRNQNFFDLRADRGPTASDITHYFSGSWMYQLPGFKGQNALVRHGLGGWQITGIFSAQTGLPMIITQSSTTSAQRADYVGGNAVLSDYQSTLRYLNPAAFKLIPYRESRRRHPRRQLGPWFGSRPRTLESKLQHCPRILRSTKTLNCRSGPTCLMPSTIRTSPGCKRALMTRDSVSF